MFRWKSPATRYKLNNFRNRQIRKEWRGFFYSYNRLNRNKNAKEIFYVYPKWYSILLTILIYVAIALWVALPIVYIIVFGTK